MKDKIIYLLTDLKKFSILFLAFTLLYSPGFSQRNSKSATSRFMSRNMKNISVEQGIRYLAQAKLGTASKMPNSDTILVTALPSELIKARVLLELIDTKHPWVVLTYPSQQYANIPNLSQLLTDNIENIQIGTFASPPQVTQDQIALVDTNEDFLIVAAPADQIDKVISALENLSQIKQSQDESITQTPVIEKTVPTKTEPKRVTEENDELFKRLMDSLAEAERIETQLKGKPIKPDIQPDPQPIETVDENTDVPSDSAIPAEAVPDTQSSPVNTSEERASTIVDIKPRDKTPAFERLTYEPEPIELANKELELDLPETLLITELIDLVGKHLNLDLLYDKNEVKGDVTLRVQDKIKVGELYPLLESVLRFRGFVMSRKGNLVTIVPGAKAAEIDPLLLDDLKRMPEFGDVAVTRIFTLRFIDTQSAKNLLDKMKLGLQVEGIEQAGKLVVTGYTYRMPRIEEILAMIDQPGKTKQFRYRQLRFTMARNLATQIETLAGQIGTVSITVAATPAAQAAPARRGRRPAKPAPQPPAAQAAKDSTSVYLDADERTNRILMIGMPEQLDVVETLIDSLDVAQQDLRTLRLYDMQYVGAEEVVDKLAELGIISATRSASQRGIQQRAGRITSRDRRGQQQQQQTPQPEAPTVLTEEGLVEEPQVVIIESTNSLLVNATAEQHASIATIIGYVDAEPQQAALNYIVYPLENQDPEELATILNQLVQETTEETQDKGSKIVKTTTKSRIEEDITIIADKTTFSLIVYASRKNQQWIQSLIKNLDKRRPQVLIDVTLVEITKNDEFNYDLNLLSSLPDLVSTSGLTGPVSGSGTDAIGIGDIITGLKDSGRSRFIDLQSNSGAATAFYGNRDIMILFEAIQTKNYGRIMARPKLLVNDNEQGTIKSEETTYRTRTKTDFIGVENPQRTEEIIFEAYDAGITLDITPHISEGELLKLEITLTRSDFRETAASLDPENPTPPDKITSDVSTIITVPDQSTIILGGLERLNQGKGGSKVPLLGDIPLIGGLFRGIANTDDQSRLYVFVKAHIIRPDDKMANGSDIAVISAKNRAKFEKYEAEMQEYEDWPGVKPKPMDPLKVLEED